MRSISPEDGSRCPPTGHGHRSVGPQNRHLQSSSTPVIYLSGRGRCVPNQRRRRCSPSVSPEGLWAAAGAVAEERGNTLSDVLRAALRAYVDRDPGVEEILLRRIDDAWDGYIEEDDLDAVVAVIADIRAYLADPAA